MENKTIATWITAIIIITIATATTTAVWDSNYDQRLEININSVATLQETTTYPLKIVLNSSNFNYSESEADGADVRCVNSADTDTVNITIEKWNESGHSIIYCLYPITNSTNTTGYIYSGNSTVSTMSNYVSVFRNESMYITANDNFTDMGGVMDATESGTVDLLRNYSDDIRRFYGVYDFDGGADNLETPTAATLSGTWNNYTVAFWINSKGAGTDYLGNYHDDSTEALFRFHNDSELTLKVKIGNSWSSGITIAGAQDSTWHHIAATFTSSNVTAYKDGVDVGGADLNIPATQDDIQINCLYSGSWVNCAEYDFSDLYIVVNEIKTPAYIRLMAAQPTYTITEKAATPQTDLDITAIDAYNATSITSFTATITWPNATNETVNTINGTIHYNNISTSNITINITYWNITSYYNLTESNVEITANTTNTQQGNIIPTESDQYMQVNATSFYNQTGIQNFSATVNGTEKTTLDGMLDTGILANNTNTFNITIHTVAGHNNRTIEGVDASTDANATYQLIPTTPYYLTIIARNYLNTTNLTSVTTNVNGTGETQTSNPFQHEISNYVNTTDTWNIIQVNITDNTLYHRNYTTTINVSNENREFYLVMESNQLILTFYKNTTLNTTEGYIVDTANTDDTTGIGRIDFQNTTVVIVQQNLAEGRVDVAFNMDGDGINHTQFYEYENEYDTHINENLELLQKEDWYIHIRALSYANAPMEGVTIRAYYQYRKEVNDLTARPHKLMGQRLTNEDGITHFWGDTDSTIVFILTKENYETRTIIHHMGHEQFDRSTSFDVYMRESSAIGVYQTGWLGATTKFNSTDTWISGTFFKPNADTIKIQTNYRESIGLTTPIDITTTKDGLDRYSFNLTNGTDFITGENLTLELWIDGTLWRNFTIEYDSITKTNILTFQHYSEKILNIILAIAIIVATATAGLIFRSINSGVTTFFIASIIAGIIQIQFLFLTAIVIIGWLLKAIAKRFIEE